MICLICACKEELNAMAQLCTQLEPLSNRPYPAYHGRLHGQEISLALCGVGKAYAASTVTDLINRDHPNLIINVGSAGGLRPNQEIGDLIVAEKTSYHDLCFNAHDPHEDLHAYSFETADEDVSLFCDCLKELSLPFHRGHLISGDLFVMTQAQYQKILDLAPDAIAADMESNAILQIATRYRVPCLVLRGLSDIALRENPSDFDRYIKKASQNAAQTVAHFLKRRQEAASRKS